MRTSRPLHAPARSRSTRPARATALVALGTVALVGTAPAAALADDAAPEPVLEPAPVDDATVTLALPSEVQEDQVVPPAQDAETAPEAPAEETPAGEAPADAPDVDPAEPAAPGAPVQASVVDPADETDPAGPADPADPASDPASSDPSADPTSDPASDPTSGAASDPAGDDDVDPEADPTEPPLGDPDVPVVPPCVTLESCFGTGKTTSAPALMSAGVTATGGAPLAGAVLEIDVAGTTPEPEWTGVTDASGVVPGGYVLAPGASATVRIVAAPEGAMLTDVTSQSFGPCVVPFGSGMPCSYRFDAEVTPAYRVLDLSVVTSSGQPVEGATFELWGTPSGPVADLVLQAPGAPLVRVATATSGAGGRLSFGPVAPGTYELRATHVPAGFQGLTGAIPLTVGAVGTVAEADVALVVPVALAAVPVPVTPVTVPVTPAPAVVPVAVPVVAAAPVATVAAPARPAAPARSAALAATGAEPVGLAGVAAALLALGVAATAAARRAARRI